MFIFGLIIGLIAGGIGVFLLLKKDLETNEKLNEEIRRENGQIEQQNMSLREENSNLTIDNNKLNNENESLRQKQLSLTDNIYTLEEQAKTASELFYKQSMETMQLKLEQSAEQERIKFVQQQEEYEKEYLATLEEFVQQYQNTINDKQSALFLLETQLIDLRSRVDSAVAESKRKYALQMENKYYRLQITDQDLKEIEKLKEIIPYLRDPESLNKVIWKVYYEKPYTDLVGRVVGQETKTGIYKITNINNEMCYVGQAVNIAERWRQHIKRGIGAETPTRNKLYPAMMQDGVENFTFEIIEECGKNELNDKEDYWQEFYHAKDFGYSIK